MSHPRTWYLARRRRARLAKRAAQRKTIRARFESACAAVEEAMPGFLMAFHNLAEVTANAGEQMREFGRGLLPAPEERR